MPQNSRSQTPASAPGGATLGALLPCLSRPSFLAARRDQHCSGFARRGSLMECNRVPNRRSSRCNRPARLSFIQNRPCVRPKLPRPPYPGRGAAVWDFEYANRTYRAFIRSLAHEPATQELRNPWRFQAQGPSLRDRDPWRRCRQEPPAQSSRLSSIRQQQPR